MCKHKKWILMGVHLEIIKRVGLKFDCDFEHLCTQITEILSNKRELLVLQYLH